MDTHIETQYGESLQVETRGIDLIGDGERRGRARDLFSVWAAPNVSVLNFTIGAMLVIMLGLEFWQAILVIAVSSLFWVFPGIVAVSGPAAGTSGSVITRAMFGVRGNKITVAIFGWFISGVFLALNWVASTFMGAELATRWGAPEGAGTLLAVTIVVSALTVFVAVYGHQLILRSYGIITLFLLVVFLVSTGFMVPHIDLSFSQPEPLQGLELWSMMSIGFAILASTPLSYSNSADLARYLPRSTSPVRIATATALGGAIPSFVFTSIGVFLGTVVTSDAVDIGIEYSLLELFPGWFGPVFVIAIVLNTVALNGMTTYTASMALQSIGVPIRRVPSAVLIGVLGTLFTAYLTTSTTLLEAVNLLLQFLLIISVPFIAIYVTDIILRRNRYDGVELFVERPGGRFWYAGGFGTAGLLSFVLGGIATALCLSTDVWTGPVAVHLGYVDLSVWAGMVVSVASYWLFARRGVRGSSLG